MGKTVAFGYKMAWLAVRSPDPLSVIAGLGIRGAAPASWSVAVDAVYSSESFSEHAVLVTPALDGWVLVASPAYLEEASDVEPERLERFVTDTASRLGTEVQLFATHRAVEGHAWAKADVGGLQRAFFYLGEKDLCLLDSMPKSTVETQLWDTSHGTELIPDESTVMSVARAWSVDPTGIESRFPEAADCYLGSVGTTGTEPSPTDLADQSRRSPWWKFW